MKVRNKYLKTIDYDAAVALMDDDLRVQTHMEFAPCTDQKFFTAYCVRHFAKFWEEFEPNKSNPVW